ncbi:Hypothetical predicted protein [Olea europaea subsp. europaea]|uniref:Uncharacterized protein n=1 Tax=Olea europaea subsp. europaea TaxID=158383 RepID=A0A8S0SE64_OLEEU|nr:Hypothetical predicted protein [Olea europaea subsp. europaea]
MTIKEEEYMEDYDRKTYRVQWKLGNRWVGKEKEKDGARRVLALVRVLINGHSPVVRLSLASGHFLCVENDRGSMGKIEWTGICTKFGAKHIVNS